MKFAMLVPEILVKSERLHTRFIKEILEDLLKEHHQKVIPGHFNRTAVAKYGYMARTSRVGRLSYDAWKSQRYGSNSPLVKTGKSKQVVTTQRRITLGGSVGRGFNGKLILRMPIAGGTGRKKATNTTSGVTPDVMISEISRLTREEIQHVADELQKRYVQKVNSDTSPRQRIAI